MYPKGLRTLLYKYASLFGLMLITACGFEPMYGEHSAAGKELPQIKIATIAERHGQILRNHLLDIITPKGTPKHPLYTLETTLEISTRDIGIQRDETANRKQVTVKAKVELRDNHTREVVHTRTVTTFNSFTIQSQNYYATEIGEDAAIKEALRLTAQKIKLDIASFLVQHEN